MRSVSRTSCPLLAVIAGCKADIERVSGNDQSESQTRCTCEQWCGNEEASEEQGLKRESAGRALLREKKSYT